MSDIYQAVVGDRYLSRVEGGVEYLVKLGVRPINPLWTWDSNHPWGLLNVAVAAVTAAGVEETAETLGAGDAAQLDVGWVHHTSRGHGTELRVQVFKRLRTHPIRVMPTEEADALLVRLRAAQIERHRLWEEREAPQRALEQAAWERQIAEIDEMRERRRARK